MTNALKHILEQAQQLSAEEQLSLIAQLAEELKQRPNPPAHPRWSDLEGAVSYPWVADDAQSWITSSRQEGDAHRDASLRGDT